MIVFATFWKLLKEPFKFREFFLVESNTIEIHGLVLFNQFY